MSGNLAPGNAFVAIGAGTKLHLIYKSYTNLTTLAHSHTHTYPYIHRGGRTQIAHMHTQLATQVNLSKAVDLTGLSLSLSRPAAVGAEARILAKKEHARMNFCWRMKFLRTHVRLPHSLPFSLCVCVPTSAFDE